MAVLCLSLAKLKLTGGVTAEAFTGKVGLDQGLRRHGSDKQSGEDIVSGETEAAMW